MVKTINRIVKRKPEIRVKIPNRYRVAICLHPTIVNHVMTEQLRHFSFDSENNLKYTLH